MGNISCGLGSVRRRSNKRKRKAPNIPSSPTESTQHVVHSDPQPSESGSTLSEVQPGSQPSESAGTQSEVQPNPQLSESEVYNVCYRHTGEDLPSDNWWNSYNYHRSDEKRSAQQILEDVDEQAITHLTIKYKLPSSLKDIAPNVTHLRIMELEDCSQLDSLRGLMELKVLILWDSYFPSGLPSAIGELKSLTELSLVGCELIDLPDNLRELMELKVLYLQNTGFASGLPSVIGELKSLTELSLLSCQLTDLPDNLRELKELKVLNIAATDFLNDLPSVIGELKSLTELSISGCGRTDLPENMNELNQLKVLELGGNDFSKGLPEVITELTSLTKLSLLDCQLTSLPPSMSELNQLKVLDLGFNDFSKGLPDVIPKLPSLTELLLGGCHLSSLPPSMSELRRLNILKLEGSNFSGGLPEVIPQLTSLTELTLMNCLLTSLPSRIGQLQQLEKLGLKGNNFSNGLSDEIGDLNSLTQLYLAHCSLTDLPSSLGNLKRLLTVDLRANKLTKIPPVIYELEKLEKLLLSENSELVKMDEGILQLKKLRIILLDGTSLPPPLGDVALQGVEMIKKYFSDLARNAVVSTIPVAIIGDTQAGKTSIRKSLITRKRELIHRSSPKENMTEVFEVEPLELKASKVNLIDFGGHDIYHVTYQLALKETCVPLLVVDMGRYTKLIEEARREEPSKRHIKEEEATKHLCMEWLCHLYAAKPTLGRPMLALTHIDQCRKTFEELKDTLITKSREIQENWLEREKKWLEKEKERFKGTTEEDDVKSERISCIKMMEFSDKDIFEFTDETNSSHIEELRTRIEERCVGKIPQNWKDVEDELKKLDKEPYIELSDVTKKFRECTDILKYLHNTGAILWFDQKEELKNYVFHHTKAVTDMVALLFPPDKKMATECKVLGFFFKGKEIGKREHTRFLENLTKTPGMIDEAFLFHEVETQTKFKFKEAENLLKYFHIIYGPIELKDVTSSRNVYLVPSLIERSLDEPLEIPDELKPQLRLDLCFNGLPLPKHVYHLMTVVVLDLKKESEDVEAYSHGAEVAHDEYSTTYFVHDYDHQKVTVQVSTNVTRLKESWDRLKYTATALKSWLKEEWPACLVEPEIYCTHCLFLKDREPGSVPNPDWYFENTTYPMLDKPRCLKSKDIRAPRAFLMPCAVPDKTHIAELEGCLTKWQSEAVDADMRQEVS